MSCHSVAGIGSLGGGALGPDLTGAYDTFGAGLDAVLETIASPTMRPIYDDRPLSPAERTALVAFLAEARTAERPAGAVGKLAALGLGGAAALVALGLVVWRRRLLGVRAPLVRRSTQGRT